MALMQKTVLLLFFSIIGLFTQTNSLLSAEFNNGELTEYNDFNKIMFSAKIINDSHINNQLLVVKNDNVFIRESNKNGFEYIKVKNMCYKLENMCVVCIKNGKIYNIVCNTNKKNTEMLTGLMIGDPFFNENNDDCNKMKFEVVNEYFIKNKQITYAIYQLYLLGYYDVARLVLFKNNNDGLDTNGADNEYNIDKTLTENNNMNTLINDSSVHAFVISSKNDISCSPYDKFLIHNHTPLAILQAEAKKNKNKNKNKTNSKNQNEEDYKLIYGRIALKGYKHLKKYENIKDINNVVILLQNDKVKEINIVALEFKWNTMLGQQLLSPYSFEYEIKDTTANNNANGKNNNKTATKNKTSKK